SAAGGAASVGSLRAMADFRQKNAESIEQGNAARAKHFPCLRLFPAPSFSFSAAAFLVMKRSRESPRHQSRRMHNARNWLASLAEEQFSSGQAKGPRGQAQHRN